jgi:hypothetical protein
VPGAVVVAGVLAAALYVLTRGGPRRPCGGAPVVTGIALPLTSPSYRWYALLVVAPGGAGRPPGTARRADQALRTGTETGTGGSTPQAVSHGVAAPAVPAGALLRRTAPDAPGRPAADPGIPRGTVPGTPVDTPEEP